MPKQSDFPSEWVSDCGVKVEVNIDGDWIEIPTTSVEQWSVKGQVMSIQRSAKVKFPTEWAGEPVRNLIETYQPGGENGLMEARVKFDSGDTWTLTHHGWVQGVGPSGDVGVSNMWIRDFGELLSATPVTGTFNHPTVFEAFREIAQVTSNRSAIPIQKGVISPPETAEERAQVPTENLDVLQDQDTPYFASSAAFDEFNVDRSVDSGDFESLILDTGADIPIFGLDSKTFSGNRNTLIDMYKWFEERTGAKLHFEPTESGPVLLADIVPDRRRFIQDEVIENNDGPDTGHQVIEVIQNEALSEIAPINTVFVRGQVSAGLADEAQDLIVDIFSNLFGSTPPSDKYPIAKVQDPSLVQAAGGVELSTKTLESNATTIDGVVEDAKKELSKRLSNMSSGQVKLIGAATICPFDRIDTYETCERFIEYQQTPVTFEVEEVKHVKKASGIYETHVKVSIWANEQTFEVVEDRMEPMAGRSESQREAEEDISVLGLDSDWWW